MKLDRSFYQGPDVVKISRDLLGKLLYTQIDGQLTAGMIVETEAYSGRNDKACHAHQNTYTKRTRIMYESGGLAYVYLCYGIHHLFNIVTNVDGLADAVLIRAVEPIVGIKEMLQRRNMTAMAKNLTAGPGLLTQALGINLSHYGESLTGPAIWLQNDGIKVQEEQVIASTRIGVAYAGEDALLPWRFTIKDNPWISRKIPQPKE